MSRKRLGTDFNFNFFLQGLKNENAEANEPSVKTIGIQTTPEECKKSVASTCDIIVPTVSTYGRGIKQPARFNQYSNTRESSKAKQGRQLLSTSYTTNGRRKLDKVGF